jgi:hypothetical protein
VWAGVASDDHGRTSSGLSRVAFTPSNTFFAREDPGHCTSGTCHAGQVAVSRRGFREPFNILLETNSTMPATVVGGGVAGTAAAPEGGAVQFNGAGAEITRHSSGNERERNFGRSHSYSHPPDVSRYTNHAASHGHICMCICSPACGLAWHLRPPTGTHPPTQDANRSFCVHCSAFRIRSMRAQLLLTPHCNHPSCTLS